MQPQEFRRTRRSIAALRSGVVKGPLPEREGRGGAGPLVVAGQSLYLWLCRLYAHPIVTETCAVMLIDEPLRWHAYKKMEQTCILFQRSGAIAAQLRQNCAFCKDRCAKVAGHASLFMYAGACVCMHAYVCNGTSRYILKTDIHKDRHTCKHAYTHTPVIENACMH